MTTYSTDADEAGRATAGELETFRSFFIGGQWVRATEATNLVISPNTGEPFARTPLAQPADVDSAVDAARAAFAGDWPTWEPARRADVLETFADALERRVDAIAERVSMQNGMPISTCRVAEAGVGPVLLRYYAGLIREDRPDERWTPSSRSRVVHTAGGVIAAIVPWNYPQALAFTKIAPALAAGCTVVLKPSPETVLDAYLVAEAAAESELPAGVLNIVPGGRETGAYMVTHPGIDHVAFTGSTAAGRSVAREAGALIRPATLELGGKSAAIVLEDSDLTQHWDAFYGATLLNNGQTCFLSTRILVPQTRHRELLELISDFAADLRIGSSLEETTMIGPLVSERQRERVLGYINEARRAGARATVGGGTPEHQERGWFVEPTVFTDLDNGARIAREEVFGPVLCILPYRDVDEAVAIANDSDYGLGGSVWTEDLDRGVEVASRLETGGVGINGTPMDIFSPYGGVKASGIGRELGPEGLRTFQATKSIYIPAADAA